MAYEPSAALLDRIYDAAADPAQWPETLTTIADATGSQGALLVGQSVRVSAVYFDHQGRLSAACMTAFKARHVLNPWALHMADQAFDSIVGSDEVMPLAA